MRVYTDLEKWEEAVQRIPTCQVTTQDITEQSWGFTTQARVADTPYGLIGVFPLTEDGKGADAGIHTSPVTEGRLFELLAIAEEDLLG